MVNPAFVQHVARLVAPHMRKVGLAAGGLLVTGIQGGVVHVRRAVPVIMAPMLISVGCIAVSIENSLTSNETVQKDNAHIVPTWAKAVQREYEELKSQQDQ